MGVTRLERKGRKNKNVAKNRVAAMKRLNSLPSIKNIDIEAIKEEFAKKAKAEPTPKAEKEAVKAEVADAPVKKEKASSKSSPEATEATKETKKKVAPKAEKKEPVAKKEEKKED